MSFFRVLSLFSVALLGSSLAACGGDENSASDTGEFAEKYCELMGGCCGENGYPSDGAQCRSLFAFASGEYNADAGQKCLAAARAAADADPNWCTASSSEANEACDAVFAEEAGSAQPGAACDTDSDCAPGAPGDYVSCNFGGADFEDRKCQRLSPVEAGAACLGDGRLVDGELRVDYTGDDTTGGYCPRSADLACDRSSKTCVALVAVGESCDAAECVDGAYCKSATTGATCVAMIALGESCEEPGDQCVEPHFCDRSTLVCTALKAVGEACESGSECESFSCEESKCSGGLGAALGLGLLCGEKE